MKHTMKKPTNIKNRIREVARESLIIATEELCEQVEMELEKYITADFIEKIRAGMLKKAKDGPQK